MNLKYVTLIILYDRFMYHIGIHHTCYYNESYINLQFEYVEQTA